MAVLVIAEAPGMSSVQDDAITEALGIADNPPQGGRFRCLMEGGYRIVSLWESRDHFDAFLEGRLRPALQAAGRSVPEVTFWQIDKIRSYN